VRGWRQLSAYLDGEDFGGIADDARSILISHRQDLGGKRSPVR